MRIATTSVGILLGIALASPAFAAVRGSGTITSLSSCRATDKKCVSDMQKQWQRQQRDFDRDQRKKLTEWLEAHPQVVSAEWEQERRAFSEQLLADAKAFREDLKKRQKEFYDALKEKIPTSDARLQGKGAQQLLPGQQECADKYLSNPEMYRLCLRSARVDFLLKLRQQSIEKSAAGTED